MSRVRRLGLVNTEHLAWEGFCRILVTKMDAMNSAQVGNCGQTATGRDVYDRWDTGDVSQLVIMTTYWLHLCAHTCVAWNGPFISGSVTTREAEIQRETDIRRPIGSICLSCGKRYGSPPSRVVRHMAPIEWETLEFAPTKSNSVRWAARVPR